MSIVFQNTYLIIIMFLLLCCSAFFSGTETALFSLTRIQILDLKHEKNKISRIIYELMKNPSDLLVSVLLGNLTVNILFFCLSTVINAEIGKIYGAFSQIAFGITILFVVIIFGEIMPKSVGLKFSVKFSKITCYPIMFWIKISFPLRKIIVFIVQKIFPLKNNSIANINEKELKLLLDISEKKGAICSNTSDMIEDIIAMISLRAKQIMLPRVDFVQCSAEAQIDNAITKAKRNNVYLLPVYKKVRGEIIGFLDIKKLILSEYKKTDKAKDCLKEAVFVPETKNVAELLNEMLEKSLKIVFVVDEYGDIAGLITKEKLLKEITGELNIDREASNLSLVHKINNDKYRIQATLPFYEMRELFKGILEFENNYKVSSLGGFIISMLGRNPKEGDVVIVGNLVFEVERVKRNRIISLMLTITRTGKKKQ